LRSNITFTTLKSAANLLDKVSGIENLDSHRFDKISKEVKEGVLIVTGERQRESVLKDSVGSSLTAHSMTRWSWTKYCAAILCQPSLHWVLHYFTWQPTALSTLP
jgi:hypothetical protein